MGRLSKQAERKSPYMLLLLVVFLWGVNSVSIKYLTEFFPPLLLAAVRLLLAGSFLFGIFLLKNKTHAAAPCVGGDFRGGGVCNFSASDCPGRSV